jgi:hypothetical protein
VAVIVAEVPSRRTQWAGLTTEQTLAFIADELDEMDRVNARMDKRIGKLLTICTTILCSLVTASILLALNLVVGP